MPRFKVLGFQKVAQSDKMPQEMSLECQLGLKTNKFREDRESDGAGPDYKDSADMKQQPLC